MPIPFQHFLASELTQYKPYTASPFVLCADQIRAAIWKLTRLKLLPFSLSVFFLGARWMILSCGSLYRFSKSSARLCAINCFRLLTSGIWDEKFSFWPQESERCVCIYVCIYETNAWTQCTTMNQRYKAKNYLTENVHMFQVLISFQIHVNTGYWVITEYLVCQK